MFSLRIDRGTIEIMMMMMQIKEL